MFDYITIIEKTSIDVLPTNVSGILVIVLTSILLVPTIIHYIIFKVQKRSELIEVLYTELIAGAVTLICCVVFCVEFQKYFLVPSGAYEYKATIDKNKISVTQYEEFIEKYKPEIKDGYYYFKYEDLEESK